jgi:hypothetical protein
MKFHSFMKYFLIQNFRRMIPWGLGLASFVSPVFAELGQGTISALLLDVDKTVGGQTTPAVVGDVIQNGGQIVTRGGSLAELSFPDGSKIRVGNNSVFSFDANDRTVKLERGTALVCTPPKAEGINVVSGGVTGTIPGDPAGKTFMITAYPPEAGGAGAQAGAGTPGATGGFGVLVIQGNSATTVSAPSGSVSIGPGQFALIGSKAGGAPKVFNVDVGQVYRSSPLINAFPSPLPTAGAILQTATQQQATIRTGGMNSTGTVGLAVASDGTILTGSSKPKATSYTFTMASSVPGTGQERNATAQEKLEDLSTAAGGGGGGAVPGITGFGGGGQRFGRFTTPGLVNVLVTRPPPPPTPVTASANVVSKVYDGTAAAVLNGAAFTTPATGISLANDTVGAFASPNVGAAVPVNTFMSITGPDVALYNFTTPTLVGQITARPLQMLSPIVTSIEYNGRNTFSETRLWGAADLNNIIGSEQLNVTGNGTFVGSPDVTKDSSGNYLGRLANMTYALGNGANGGLAGNYFLDSPTPQLLVEITEKTLSYASPAAAGKVYDGTVGATVTLGSVQGLVGLETLVIGETSAFNNKNVGTGKTVSVNFNLANGSNGGKASNYRLNNLSLSADITAKPVDVDMTAAVISKAYNGTASVTVTGADLGRIAVGSGIPSDRLAYAGDTVGLAANPAVTLERALPGTLIPVIGTGFSLTGADAANYSLRQPSGLTGEITGSASLNRDGVALNLSSAQTLHLRNTTATRMQEGLNISTTAGQILIENSTFDGWMQRDNTPRTINSATGTTISFTETANVAVNSPVLRVQMEPNSPNFMLLGDYQLRLQRDPDANPATANSVGATLFTFPGVADDPNAIGSLAPSADLVLRDSATTELRGVDYDAPEYSPTLDSNGEAVTSGNFAPVEGEFNPDGSVRMSDLDVATASGTWNVTLDQPVISGEGKVTDVRLKYNNNTRALIESPDGVRLLNVVFEGMDQVDVRTAANLDNRVLLSGTLVSDPNISKMIVQVGQKLEAHFNSDATLAEVSRQGSVGAPGSADAAIMAGVREKVGGGLEFIPGSTDRVLEMQRATVAGQLSLASATVVFNNANISSGGVILVSTRNGVVNRTYGSVVPGAVSFIGGSGNFFQNTANGQSMNIANSGHIGTAFTSGKLSESGAGTGTVMSVGRVQ